MKTNSKIIEQLTETNSLFSKKLKTKPYYKSIYDVVLREGKLFESKSITNDESKIIEKALKKSKQTKLGQCFYNAQCLCLSDESNQIEYWEGFTYDSEIQMAILHGFNTINGKVIDITHKINGKYIKGVFGIENEYMGVKFDKKMIIERICTGKDCTSFIDNWREGYPILKNKWMNPAA